MPDAAKQPHFLHELNTAGGAITPGIPSAAIANPKEPTNRDNQEDDSDETIIYEQSETPTDTTKCMKKGSSQQQRTQQISTINFISVTLTERFSPLESELHNLPC